MRHGLSILIAAVAVAAAPPAMAQTSETTMAFEMRPTAGIYLPTGQMRHDFKAAALLGFQGGLEVNDHAHLLLGGAWAQTEARFPAFTRQRTDIWQFDAGAELNLIRRLDADWLFRPFVGAGIGARTYDYEMPGVGSRTCTVGYGSVGTEFQRHLVAARFESRNNLSCFRSPVTGEARTRYDLGLTLGLVYHVM
jgi:hypothetical protein